MNYRALYSYVVDGNTSDETLDTLLETNRMRNTIFNYVDTDGKTAFYCAIERRCSEIALTILKHMTIQEVFLMTKNTQYSSALSLAIFLQDVPVVAAIIDKCFKNHASFLLFDATKGSVLQQLIFTSDVLLILSVIAVWDVENLFSRAGYPHDQSIFDISLSLSESVILRAIISRLNERRFKINGKIHRYKNLMHALCRLYEYPETIHRVVNLMEINDFLVTTETCDQTILHLAVQYKHEVLFTAVIDKLSTTKAGCFLLQSMLVQKHKGFTVLHTAVKGGYLFFTKTLMHYMKPQDILLYSNECTPLSAYEMASNIYRNDEIMAEMSEKLISVNIWSILEAELLLFVEDNFNFFKYKKCSDTLVNKPVDVQIKFCLSPGACKQWKLLGKNIKRSCIFYGKDLPKLWDKTQEKLRIFIQKN